MPWLESVGGVSAGSRGRGGSRLDRDCAPAWVTGGPRGIASLRALEATGETQEGRLLASEETDDGKGAFPSRSWASTRFSWIGRSPDLGTSNLPDRPVAWAGQLAVD